MDHFDEVADKIIVNKIRKSWLEISKMYNEMALAYEGTMAMGFLLLTIDDENGTPVTKIGPRLGMEPNSLSRILKTLEKRNAIIKRHDLIDKRKVYIHLTDFGREMRLLAFKRVYDFEMLLRQKIDAKNISIFFNVINEISDAAKLYKDTSDN